MSLLMGSFIYPSHLSLIYLIFYIYLSPIHLSFIHLSLTLLIYHLFILPQSGIVTAGRIPSCGGIAHPKGKHSRHMTVFCLPAADSSARIGDICFAKG
jgi:hypothetical protein